MKYADASALLRVLFGEPGPAVPLAGDRLVSSELIEIESFRARVAGAAEMSPVAVRVTTVFRRDDGDWKVVLRHADSIIASRPPDSVFQT